MTESKVTVLSSALSELDVAVGGLTEFRERIAGDAVNCAQEAAVQPPEALHLTAVLSRTPDRLARAAAVIKDEMTTIQEALLEEVVVDPDPPREGEAEKRPESVRIRQINNACGELCYAVKRLQSMRTELLGSPEEDSRMKPEGHRIFSGVADVMDNLSDLCLGQAAICIEIVSELEAGLL